MQECYCVLWKFHQSLKSLLLEEHLGKDARVHATCKCPVENCNLQVTSMEVQSTNKYYLEGGLAREQQNLPITVQIQNT
jgi:hypothetical protein